MIEPITRSIAVVICDDAQQAIEQGFQYGADHKVVNIQQAVVVRDGTESGKPTVDLIMVDAQGNKYVAMLTGSLLKSIPC